MHECMAQGNAEQQYWQPHWPTVMICLAFQTPIEHDVTRLVICDVPPDFCWLRGRAIALLCIGTLVYMARHINSE